MMNKLKENKVKEINKFGQNWNDLIILKLAKVENDWIDMDQLAWNKVRISI